MNNNAILLKEGQGKTASFQDKTIILKVTGSETNNAFCLMEYTLKPSGKGSGFHIHKTFEKSIYVLEGVLTIQIEDKLIEAPKGMFVMIPRNVAHDFYNPSTTNPVYFLMHFSPAGFENLFIEMSALDFSQPTAKEKIKEIRSRYDVIDIAR